MEDINEYYNSECDLLTEKIFGISYIDTNPYDNNTTKRCYCVSNEYLQGYMQQFDLRNKRVATVGSSGDQMLNSLLYGSRDITLIDANIYTMAYVEYKIALIKELDFKTFRKNIGTRGAFHWKTYRQISHHLLQPIQQLWDRIMLEQDAEEDTFYPHYNCFTASDIDDRLTQGCVEKYSEFYVSEEAYNRLKQILLENKYKLDYKVADIFDFPNKLEGRFDLILLSNIYNYIEGTYLKEKFGYTLKQLYNNNLNQGGTIQTDYEFYKIPVYNKDKDIGLDFRKTEIKHNNHTDTAFFLDKPNFDIDYPEDTLSR